MTLVEKIAYTKGFFSGLNIDGNTKEGKAFNALLELLEDIVVSNTDLEQQCSKLKSQVKEIDEHVSEVFNNVFDNASFGSELRVQANNGVLYEVVCPECGTKTTFGQTVALSGRMDCPGCGINLEFDYDDTPMEKPLTVIGDVTPVLESLEPEHPQEIPAAGLDGAEDSVTVSLKEPEMAGMNFSTTPNIQGSAGEQDQIPQTEDFVYSESTEDEDDRISVKLEKVKETEEGFPASETPDEASREQPAEAGEAVQPEAVKQLEAETEDEKPIEADGKEDQKQSALVKVDFVADPEAFEAGRQKAEEYKFSADNVKTDFGVLIPEIPQTMEAPEA